MCVLYVCVCVCVLYVCVFVCVRVCVCAHLCLVQVCTVCVYCAVVYSMCRVLACKDNQRYSWPFAMQSGTGELL